MEDSKDNRQQPYSFGQVTKSSGEQVKISLLQTNLLDRLPAGILKTSNQNSGNNDLNACQDGAINDDCEQISSSVHKLDKRARLVKRPRKFQDEQNEILIQSGQQRQKIDGSSFITLTPDHPDDQDDQDGEYKDSDDDSIDKEDNKKLGKTKPKHGCKKQNFTARQTQILKQWFVKNADNPYLKEENRKELSEATGLDQRQVSNWFTNVRKRVWQPLKKKNKNRDVNDFMLKVKLKLETDGMHPSVSNDGSDSERSHKELIKDSFKLSKHIIKQRQHQQQIGNHIGSQMGSILEEMVKNQNRQNSQMGHITSNTGHQRQNDAFNIIRNSGQQTALPSLSQQLGLSPLPPKFPQTNIQNALSQLQHQQTQQQQQQQQQQQHHQPVQQSQPSLQKEQLFKILEQMRREVQIKQMNEQMSQQQNNTSQLNNLTKNLQQVPQDTVQNQRPNILQQQQQTQQDNTNSQLIQMSQKVPIQLMKDINQMAASKSQLSTPMIQNDPLNQLLALQRQQSIQSQQTRLQQNSNLHDQFKQIEMLKAKMTEALHQELKQKPIPSSSQVPTQVQLAKSNIQQSAGQQQNFQTEPILSNHRAQKNINQIASMAKHDIDPRTQIYDINNGNFEQTKRKEDNIIKSQMTQKESMQGEDLRSLASKYHMNKNLVEIDFKIIDKDQNASHNYSMVEKEKHDKGAINLGVMSDTSLHQNAGNKIALKKFFKDSKNLRYRQKMKNVMQWRSNQLEFANNFKDSLEDPALDEQNQNLYQELTPERIEMIENEFLEHQKMVDQFAKQKDLEKESDHRNLSQKAVKGLKERNSSRRRQDGSKNDEEQSNDGVEVVSLHRSKSLSNNRSLSQFEDQVTDNQVNTINAPFQFIPIVLISCPNVVRGGHCKCGYDGFYPANDFYKNQLQQFVTHQGQLLNPNKGNNSSKNNSKGSGAGGSGGSGCADSGAGRVQNGSSSNHQSNGNSWQTTGANCPHPFLALLNQFNNQANVMKNNLGGSEIAQKLENTNQGIHNMTHLIDKISQTCTQVKDKLKEKQSETPGQQALTHNGAATDQTPNSQPVIDANGSKQLNGENIQFQADTSMNIVGDQKQATSQHIIPPSVNFISHLEQASLLKNQLEVLNEITNQFHELMRLDKIKQKIVQLHGKDESKLAEEPQIEQAQIENQQAREENGPAENSNTNVAMTQEQQIAKGNQYTSDNTEQKETIKKRVKKHSRTMSEQEHKSSHHYDSQTNMTPNQGLKIGESTLNQLQSVLSLLYNQQKNNSNRQVDEQNKQQQNLQIIQMLKKQSMVNKEVRVGSGSGKSKATRHTDGIITNEQQPSLQPSNNWRSNQNGNSNMTESGIYSVSNNKNGDNEQMAQQNTQPLQKAHISAQTNFDKPGNLINQTQKLPLDEASLKIMLQHQRQINASQVIQDNSVQIMDNKVDDMDRLQSDSQIANDSKASGGNKNESMTIHNIKPQSVNFSGCSNGSGSNNNNLQILQILQSQQMKPPQDLIKVPQIQQIGAQANGQKQLPIQNQQIFDQQNWQSNKNQ